MKFKVTIGAFGEDAAADIAVDGRVVGWLERVHGARFSSVTRAFVGRYNLMLTDATADAQLHRRSFKRATTLHAEQQTPSITLSPQRGKRGPSQNEAVIAHREWISLGVLALEAAERAREADDALIESFYLTLARKCDACADQCLTMKSSARKLDAAT